MNDQLESRLRRHLRSLEEVGVTPPETVGAATRHVLERRRRARRWCHGRHLRRDRTGGRSRAVVDRPRRSGPARARRRSGLIDVGRSAGAGHVATGNVAADNDPTADCPRGTVAHRDRVVAVAPTGSPRQIDRRVGGVDRHRSTRGRRTGHRRPRLRPAPRPTTRPPTPGGCSPRRWPPAGSRRSPPGPATRCWWSAVNRRAAVR